MIKGLAYLWTRLRHLDNLPWLEERRRDCGMKIQSKSPLNDTCQDWALLWLTLRHLQSFLRHGAITSNAIVGSEKNKRRNKKKRLLGFSCKLLLQQNRVVLKASRLTISILWNIFERVCWVPFILPPPRTSLTLRNICSPLNCKRCAAASGREKRKRRPGMCSEWMMSPLRSASAKQETHKCQYLGTDAELAHAKCIVRTLPFGNVTHSPPWSSFPWDHCVLHLYKLRLLWVT